MPALSVMAGFKVPDACYEPTPLASLERDAPIFEQPAPLTPMLQSSSDGGTRRYDPLESHRLFSGMFDDHSPPPSTIEKMMNMDTLKSAGLEQVKQDPIVKEVREKFNMVKEAISPSPPLGTQEPAPKSGPLDFNFSFSAGAPSTTELREASLANPNNQQRPNNARQADAGRTAYNEERPDAGTRSR
jgi:hypothetical protein